jgi:hypothetical protein
MVYFVIVTARESTPRSGLPSPFESSRAFVWKLDSALRYSA